MPLRVKTDRVKTDSVQAITKCWKTMEHTAANVPSLTLMKILSGAAISQYTQRHLYKDADRRR